MLGTRQALLLLCVFGNVWSLPVKERIVRGKRSDDAAPLQAVVDDLAQQLSSVKAQLAAQQTQITNQKSKLACVFPVWTKSVGEQRNKRSDDPQPLQVVVDNLVKEMNSMKAQLAAEQTARTAFETKLIRARSAAEQRNKRSNDMPPLQVVVDNLVQEVNSLKAQLTAEQTAREAKEAAIEYKLIRTTGVREQRNKRSDDPEALQVVVDNLVQKMNSLEAKLAAEQTAREAKDAAFENKL
ncbi:hypothetical protein BaRGS_00021065, partial [Batillaria attramentaria]